MIGLALAMVASTVACDLPPGWDAIERRAHPIHHPRRVARHRTGAGVRRSGRLRAGERNERLLLAIEQSSTDDAAFQSVWAGPDADFAVALRQVPGWKGRSDGVASQAMFDLVVGLHRLRAGGKRIDVVLFSGAKDEAQRARYAGLPSQGPHEAAQAENIRTAAQAKRYDHVLVLTGSVHARKSPVERRGPAFLPMAMQLAPANETTSFRLLNGAGTSWDCQLKPGTTFKPGSPVPNDAMDCDNHPTRGEVALNGPPFAALGMPTGYTAEGAYDGYVWLGPVTGSAPAVP